MLVPFNQLQPERHSPDLKLTPIVDSIERPRLVYAPSPPRLTLCSLPPRSHMGVLCLHGPSLHVWAAGTLHSPLPLQPLPLPMRASCPPLILTYPYHPPPPRPIVHIKLRPIGLLLFSLPVPAPPPNVAFSIYFAI